MVSALQTGSTVLGSSHLRTFCFVGLALFLHSASLSPSVKRESRGAE